MKEISATTIERWRSKGSKKEQVAAWLYIWATKQEEGTEVPDDATIVADMDTVTAAVSVRRAQTMLELEGVLARDGKDGPYRVA
jgi:hypothetical protein